MTLDLDAIAREAELYFGSLDDHVINLSAETLSRFSALLLEKAAQVCEGMHEEDRPGEYAYELRAMSAALQSGDRG